MGTETDTLVDLVTDAYDLVQRHGRGRVTVPQAVSEAVLLRDELRACSAVCPDGDVTDDLDAVATELDDLLERLQHLPQPAHALTG